MKFQDYAAKRFQENPALCKRDPKCIPEDVSAVRALAQAAVNVELFTIPLYMTAMYSIQGMHQITGQNNLYQGRLWPGKAPVANPQTANDQCFNSIFSVFIQEMLHLQLASNIYNALSGQPDTDGNEKKPSPCFTSPLLVDNNEKSDHYMGWTCYGKDKTTIPHILDLEDTTKYKDVKVNLGPVDNNTMALFLAIEEPVEIAEGIIEPKYKDKYFPEVPFKDWGASCTEKDLPMFGTIAYMYGCLAEYLNIEYSDGTTLFETVFRADSVQQDLFNVESGGHPYAEFPHMKTTVQATEANAAKGQIFNMMNAITDQGEGGTLKIDPTPIKARQGLMESVMQSYQPDFTSLKADYPTYDDRGQLEPSADAHARYFNGVIDHFDRFQQVKGFLDSGDMRTWPQWHADGNRWQAEMLQTPDYVLNPALPLTQDVAQALNNLKEHNTQDNQHLFSRVACGAIYGVTSVLDQFWNQNLAADKRPGFPFPSMAGSGDRVSICWAVFGETPDLSLGIYPRDKSALYHACQGLSFDGKGQPNECASKEVFHTCRGSNSCKAEGGCGFVQKTDGSGQGCGATMIRTKQTNGCSGPAPSPANGTLYTAPADNNCFGYGGCAVPISASQLYPESGTMQLYTIDNGEKSEPVGTIAFSEGEGVYDVAWKAYVTVLQEQGKSAPGEKPKPSDIRLAFPPST